ncbi:hypothetical protein [Halobacteriovorax sp.]|uniref:hypothetical protein n=1 Tax=Halobacteriovorax sp. TaxID=2020862 RepID=UPI00356686F8
MYLVLTIKLLFIFLSFSINASTALTSGELSKLYSRYVAISCGEKVDCLDFKKRKFNECKDNVCREAYINFEEIIIVKCRSGENESGCLSQFNFTSAMCEDLDCIDVVSKTAKKEIEPISLDKIRKEMHVKAPSQKIVSIPKNILPNSDQVSPQKDISSSSTSNSSPSIESLDYEPTISVQKKMMNLSQKANEDRCRTIECLEKVELAYSKLSTKDKPKEEDYSSNSNYAHIPAKLIQIYINEGPWSPEMISYFKANEKILGVENHKFLKPNCTIFRKEDCSKVESQSEWISKITAYFRDDKLGGGFAKEMFKLNHRSKHQILCNVRYRELPKGKNPFKEQITSYTDESLYFESLNPFSFSASSKLECLEKFKEYEKSYSSRLQELGNYPSKSSYSFVELGKSGQIPAPILNLMRGDCHSFTYVPNGEDSNPRLSWFQKASNKRIINKNTYEDLTRDECRFMANKDLYKLDSSRWEEYIFFMGNVPFARFSSKALPQYLSIDSFQKFPTYRHISAPKCRVTYRKSGNVLIKREYELNEEVRSCRSLCLSKKKTISSKYSDYTCSVVPGMNSNPMYGFEAEIYVEDSSVELKSCEYYNYHWSQEPIRKFLVENKEECLSKSIRSPISSKQQYLDYYRFKNNGFYDLEIKFNNSSILKYVTNADCTIRNISRIGGRTSKYIRSKKINVKTEEQCYKACLDYKAEVENALTKSPVFVSCEIGRSAYKPLILNFKKANSYDPFIAIKKSDSKSIETYFKESFEEVWHGYPFIKNMSTDI